MADARQPNSYLRSLLVRALASLNRSDLMQAERCIDQVLRLESNNPDALQLLGLVRRAQDRLEDAISLYRRSLTSNPMQAQVEHNLGNALQDVGRFFEAATAHRNAIQLKSDYVGAYAGLAVALSADGANQKALEVCRRALEIWPKNILLGQLLSATLLELRQPDEAVRILEILLREKELDSRTIAHLRFNLVLSLHQLGRYPEALNTLKAIQDGAESIPQFYDELAQLLFQQQQFEDAQSAFLQAHYRQPNSARLLASVALSAAHMDDIGTAREFAEKSFALEPRNALGMTVLACLEFKERNLSATIALINEITANINVTIDDFSYLTIGEIADRLDHASCYDASFSITQAQNERRYRDAASSITVRALDDVKRLRRHFEDMPAWSETEERAPRPLAPFQHVFVVGFMRSGTTLLSTELARQEGVIAADEIDFLTDAARQFLLNSEGLKTLEHVGGAEQYRWVDSYWKLVAGRGFSVERQVFVEKMPFNSLRLPLIARLFPEATILLAIRDPRDVVLSCMRQKFELTPFSYELLRLEDCASFYSEVMGLVELYREKLPLKLMPIRYEDFVKNRSLSMKEICSFTGIAWNDQAPALSASSNFVDPRSASANQVKKPIYKSAVGKWQHYTAQLGPALTTLEPWVSRLGYLEE